MYYIVLTLPEIGAVSEGDGWLVHRCGSCSNIPEKNKVKHAIPMVYYRPT